MPRIARLWLVAGAATIAACGAAKPRAVAAPVASPVPAKHPVAPPAPPGPVRWIMGGTDLSWTDALHTAHGTLYQSNIGERVLVPRGGPPTSVRLSWFFVPGTTVVRSGGRFAFAEASGAVSVTATPLGPPVRRRAPPSPPGTSLAAGKHALVIIAGRRVLRSADLGRTWKSTASAGGGVPQSVVMNAGGHGLLLTYPQALWKTDDDAATWKRVASPGPYGVSRVRSGADGSFWTTSEGWQVWTRLSDGHHEKHGPRGGVTGPLTALVPFLAGDRLVLGAIARGGTLMAATRSLDATGPTVWQTLGPYDCDELRVTAFGATSYVVCFGERHSHVSIWSSVSGRPFRVDVPKLDVSAPHPLVPGPDGWLLVGNKLRMKRGAGFVSAPDLQHDWAWLEIGDTLHLATIDKSRLRYARVTARHPMPAPVPLDGKAWFEPGARVVDDGGRALVLAYDGSTHFEIDPAKPNAPPLDLDDWLPPDTQELLRYGARWLAVDGGHAFHESADRGAHWTRVGWADSGLSDADHCTARGCQIGSSVRLGWQLDHATPVPRLAAPVSAPGAPATPPRAHFVCTRHAKERRLAKGIDISALFDAFSLGGAYRWLAVGEAHGVRLVGARRNGRRIERRLMPPVVAHRVSVVHVRVTPDAVVAVRETWRHNAPRDSAPDSAEMASYTLHGGAVRHARLGGGARHALRELPPVQIGWISGAAWYRGLDPTHAFVLPASGRVERRDLRGPTAERDIVGLPSGVALWDADALTAHLWRSYRVLSSATGWFAWHMGGVTHLGSWHGRPAVGVDVFDGDYHYSTEPFAVLLSARSDPEVVQHVVPAALLGGSGHLCKPGAHGGVVSWVGDAASIKLEPGKPWDDPLSASMLVRLRPDHAPCVSGWLTKPGKDGKFVDVPARDIGKALLFDYRDGDLYGAPASCVRTR